MKDTACTEPWPNGASSQDDAQIVHGPQQGLEVTVRRSFDEAALPNLLGRDPDRLRSVFLGYLDACRKSTRTLQDATVTLDFDTVHRIAHRLKSSSYMFGALSLGDVCTKLESAAASGQAEQLALLMPILSAEADAAVEWVGVQIGQTGASAQVDVAKP